MSITRREMIGGMVAGSVAASIGLANVGCEKEQSMSMNVTYVHPNEYYYTNGQFDAEKAKQAYYAMMKHFNYPIVDRLKGEEFWTLDFGTGKFTEIGMAGIFWVNNLEHNYFGHEIYLLPGQSIPEHRHMKTAAAGPKLEGWQVRYGSVTLFGEGEPTQGWEQQIPPSHKDCIKSKKFEGLEPGPVVGLAGPEQWHFMKAGPEGAIVTEYATYHDGEGLRFSHPDVKM